jgi:hypothetical protein
MKMKKTFLFLLILVLGDLMCGCAVDSTRSETLPETHPSSASYGSDYMFDAGGDSPNRPYVRWEFYYKHCTLIGQKPYPEVGEWTCNDPF